MARDPLTPLFDLRLRRGAVNVGSTPSTVPPRSFHDRVFDVTAPLRYWHLDDAASPLVDEVAGFNLAVSGSPTYQTAALSTNPQVPTSQSIDFTGSSWAEGTTGAVGGALSFTVFGWVQFTSSAEMIFIQQRDAAAFLGEWVMQTYPSGDGHLYAFGFATDAAYEFSLYSTMAINDGNPHLIGFTLDQADTTARLWIDGVLDATDTTPNGSLFDSTLNIGLGRDIRDNNKTYTGKMSDFGIDLTAWDSTIWAYVAAL